MSNQLETIKKISRIFSGGDKKPSCAAVVLAAGSSVRMGSDKILAKLGEIPVLARTLRPFQESDAISEIVVVTSLEKLNEVTELCRE
ncbi:MAG: NTP transferase domain-containing protein, partial [Oscillospiraceae bacterium]|nr:NTP transferase domain-containing protein [Oscillospiraceae bacterium]